MISLLGGWLFARASLSLAAVPGILLLSLGAAFRWHEPVDRAHFLT